MLGNNASLFQGEGFEFSELREYVYGDDIRKIDWKTTAKLGKPFVKIYKEERELNVVVVSVLGGSVYFGTVKQKSDIMAEVAATLGFSAIKNTDLFTHMIFADRLYDVSKPSKKLFAVHQAVEKIVAFEPLGKEADFNALTQTLHQRLKKKSLLFIVSDFVGEIDLKLLSKKHDVFAVIVRDRFEENPSQLGYLRLIDMQSKQSFEGDVDSSVLKGYTKALHENDERLYKQFKKQGIRFAKIYTHQEPALKLMKKMR
ncbi:MAG: DUF58 domain-containing protein [Sulfurovum sp. 28-43-6]|nr:MAG: DUF58 domain-containing protein [Sulfurovum sp. 35-42-20]OYY57762.1 MAG: DUF58 domain-containing protein [Sulfurovum sp. 28-43-6]OYZ26907.1 MAG: DUF58 domain-containing protein [Sulfurovum sp. 16-42-52]OYZ50594.1 MAG: DUF58 domain-containing protein [Sulfurovum sp. 24-42-9]OZA46733.1 MAG: DUF58 domain-containing protein [Sulfurovum sp. 17-42-90]OZA60515.1 MAG: DUF58 domain-containing protein [Sulfurovum sp. 39-42-12]